MKLKEQEIIDNIDDKITSILTDLRDGTFGNADSRKEFASMIVKLALSRDPRARKAIKRLGDYLTNLGNELLGSIEEIKEYKSIYRGLN